MGLAAHGAERLLAAALNLFGQQGYEGTTVRDIAAAAGVTPGLVVHHYGSKEGLRNAVDQYVLDSVSSAFAELLDRERVSGDQLDIRLHGFHILFQQRPNLGRYIRRSLTQDGESSTQLFEALFEITRSMFAHLRDRGLVRPTDDPEAQQLLAMLCGLLPVMLPRHIERHLGVSLRSDEGVERWTRAEYRLLTIGVLFDNSTKEEPDGGDRPS